MFVVFYLLIGSFASLVPLIRRRSTFPLWTLSWISVYGITHRRECILSQITCPLFLRQLVRYSSLQDGLWKLCEWLYVVTTQWLIELNIHSKQGEPGTRQSFTHELINKIEWVAQHARKTRINWLYSWVASNSRNGKISLSQMSTLLFLPAQLLFRTV